MRRRPVADRPHLVALAGGEIVEDLSGVPREALEARVLRAEALNATLVRDIRLAEDEHATDRARIAGLKGQISKWNRAATPDDLVEPILWRWKAACRSENSTVEVTVEGKRADLVRKTIKRRITQDQDPGLANPDKDKRQAAVETAQQRAVDAINEAIDGAIAFPYREKYGRRFSEPGPGRYRADDLLVILKDEVSLQMFRDLHEGDARRLAYAHDLKRRMDTQPNLVPLLATFSPEWPELLCRAIRYAQRTVRGNL